MTRKSTVKNIVAGLLGIAGGVLMVPITWLWYFISVGGMEARPVDDPPVFTVFSLILFILLLIIHLISFVLGVLSFFGKGHRFAGAGMILCGIAIMLIAVTGSFGMALPHILLLAIFLMIFLLQPRVRKRKKVEPEPQTEQNEELQQPDEQNQAGSHAGEVAETTVVL